MQGLRFPHLSDLLGRRGFYLFNSLLQQCHTTTDNSVEMGKLVGIKCSRLILVLTWKKVWLSLAELQLNSWKWNFFSVWGAADRLPCRWQMIKTLKLLDWHITVAMLPLVLLNASLLLLRLRLMKGFDSLARDAICTTIKLEQNSLTHCVPLLSFRWKVDGALSFLPSAQDGMDITPNIPIGFLFLELAIGSLKTSARLRTSFPVGYLPRPGQPSVHSIWWTLRSWSNAKWIGSCLPPASCHWDSSHHVIAAVIKRPKPSQNQHAPTHAGFKCLQNDPYLCDCTKIHAEKWKRFCWLTL